MGAKGRPTDRLVGRVHERAALDGALADARRGRGRVVLLAGDAGIGKTRLAEELADDAVAAGATVVWGRTWEGGGAPPMWPWVEVIRQLTPGPDAPTDLTVLVGGEASSTPETPPASPEHRRFALFDAVAGLARERAEARPLVIVLEDLHAADETTLLLAAFVARQLASWPVLLVATYRDVEARHDPAVRGLIGDVARHGDTIALAGLGAGEVAQLAGDLTGRELAAHDVARLHDATGGNPFYVREVARLIDEAAAELDVPLPETIRQTLRRRLARLSAAARQVMTAAAVIGREFDFELVASVCGHDHHSALAAIDEATASGLVAPAEGRPGRFVFAHALVFETLYGDLAPGPLMRLHLDVAHALAGLGRTDDETAARLAHHLYEGSAVGDEHDLAAAFAWAVETGARAMRRLAFERAVVQYEHALELAGRGAAGEIERGRVLVALGWSQVHNAGSPTMADMFRAGSERFLAAADIARREGDVQLLAEAAIGYCSGYSVMAVDPTIVSLAEEALAALGPDDSPYRSLCLALLATQLAYANEAERRRAVAAEAVAVARRLGLHEPLAVALTEEAHAWLGDPDVAGRLRLVDEAANLRGLAHWAPEYIPPMPDALCHMRRAAAQFELGDFAAFDATTASFRAMFGSEAMWESHHVPWLIWQAIRSMLEGPLERAERDVDAAVAAMHRFEPGAGMLCELRFVQGRLAELEEGARALVEHYPAVPAWRALQALICAETGRLDEARRLLDQTLAGGVDAIPVGEAYVATLFSLSWAAHCVEHPHAARQLYDALFPHDGHWIIAGDPGIVLCMGPVAYSLARLAVTLGDDTAARRHFTAAVGQTRARGAGVWLAMILDDLARFLSTQGDPSAAAAQAESRSLARSLGVGRLLVDRGDAARTPLAAPGASSIRREGELWRIEHDGIVVRLRSTKGVAYLARLLAEPGREFHVLDLAAGSASDSVDRGDAGAVLDETAKHAYRARLQELRAELDDAEQAGDAAAAARRQEEIDSLARELAGALGLGGRDRIAGSSAERARQAVSKAIRSAVDRIAAGHAALGEHLAGTVRTGTYCSYQPLVPVEWDAD